MASVSTLSPSATTTPTTVFPILSTNNDSVDNNNNNSSTNSAANTNSVSVAPWAHLTAASAAASAAATANSNSASKAPAVDSVWGDTEFPTLSTAATVPNGSIDALPHNNSNNNNYGVEESTAFVDTSEAEALLAQALAEGADDELIATLIDTIEAASAAANNAPRGGNTSNSGYDYYGGGPAAAVAPPPTHHSRPVNVTAFFTSDASSYVEPSRAERGLLSAEDCVEIDPDVFADWALRTADSFNSYYGEELMAFRLADDDIEDDEKILIVELALEGFVIKIGRHGGYRRVLFEDPCVMPSQVEDAFLEAVDDARKTAVYLRSVAAERSFLSRRAVMSRHCGVDVVQPRRSRKTQNVETYEYEYEYESYDSAEADTVEGGTGGDADDYSDEATATATSTTAASTTINANNTPTATTTTTSEYNGEEIATQPRMSAHERLALAREEDAASKPLHISINLNLHNSEAAKLKIVRKLLTCRPAPETLDELYALAARKLNVRRKFVAVYNSDGVQIEDVSELEPWGEYVFTHDEGFAGPASTDICY